MRRLSGSWAVAALVAVAVVIVSTVASEAGLIHGDGQRDLVVVGDSLVTQSREPLLALSHQRDITAEVHAYPGTSLCSWDEQLDLLAAEPPRVLVLSFAGNDLDPCMAGAPRGERTLGDRAPEDVAADYRRDLTATIDRFRDSGTDVRVVLPPPSGDERFQAGSTAMRDMYLQVADARPDLGVIDSATHLDPGGTGYQPTLPCEPWDDCGDRDRVQVRRDDGIHLTPAGGERYARSVLEAVTAGTNL